ncbi:hypothetical protein HQ520_13270, partial [bacterium]|nr:hypothetical protein [bacterium]
AGSYLRCNGLTTLTMIQWSQQDYKDPINFDLDDVSVILTGENDGPSTGIVLAVRGRDDGNAPSGWANNFALGTLVIGDEPGDVVTLLSGHAYNDPVGDDRAALYVSTLDMSSGASLQIPSDISLYYKTLIGGASAFTYELTVFSGTGSGYFAPGNTPSISAIALLGQTFDRWIGDVQYLDDPDSAVTIVTMPSGSVKVEATYIRDPEYALIVSRGMGSGSYAEGTTVTIEAYSYLDGTSFLRWIGDTEYLSDPDCARTTLSMPATSVNLTGIYRRGDDFLVGGDRGFASIGDALDAATTGSTIIVFAGVYEALDLARPSLTGKHLTLSSDYLTTLSARATTVLDGNRVGPAVVF